MRNVFISNEIVKRISIHKVWALIADGTQDVSKKEIIAIVIRYLENPLDSNDSPNVVERLIKTFAANNTTLA